MNRIARLLVINALAFVGVYNPFELSAQAAKDVAVLVSVSVSELPPSITLSWPAATATSYAVSRKGLEDTAWTVLTNALPGSATSFVDKSVAVASAYEYRVYKSGSPFANGYVYAGIQADLIEDRGTLILLVDSRFTSSLAVELTRLQQDLIGDGWGVIRHDVSSSETVANIKALIQADYDADPAAVKALFLFGHIPQPYSGNLNPDGHGDHYGAWPADLYYGEMNGTWTDSSVNSTSSSYPRQRNIPGDGKFDQTVIPSPVDLQVGRVDLYNMPAFALSETELLRQYLNKDHKFRHQLFTAQPRALIDDHFGYFGGEAFAASGWRAGSSWFGSSAIFTKDYISTLKTDPYLLSYGCGGGGFTSASGVGNTTDFATNQSHSVFTMLFGSYFGDWDNQNNFLRAPLASSPWVLTSCWAGRPHWFMHHMALGQPIGHSTRVTQNNNTGIYQSSSYGGYVHVGLMGDPTLRLHPVLPPSQLTTATNAAGDVVLSWTASAEAVEGYHVYRAPGPGAAYMRLNASLELSTTFVDTTAPAGSSSYMVRAVKLQESASGTYFNPSQGTFGTYPDQQVSIAVYSAHGMPTPAVGVASYSLADATVLCKLPNEVVEVGGMQFLPTGWRGTGNVPASGAALETPLITLTENSSITWQWQTNFWVSVSSDTNGVINQSSGWQPSGSTLSLTASATAFRYVFSHWSGAGVPAGMGQSNPLEIPVDAAGDVYANFAPAPNPDKTLLFAETFEDYPSDMPLGGTNAWHAMKDAAAVSTSSDLIDGIAAYALTQPYPVNTTHAKAGFIAGDTSLHVVSPQNSTVITKMLLKMTPYPRSLVPEPGVITNQLAFLLTENGELMLLHGTPLTGIELWSTFTDTLYDANLWHTITLEKDYKTIGLGCRYFRISIDNGPWLVHADGYTANDGTGSPGGAWFAFADAAASRVNGFDFKGTVGVDDILVGEGWTGQGGPGDRDNDGMWDLWEYQNFGSTNNPAGNATADWDSDGFDNLSEWLADTSPSDTNSVLAIQSIALEPSGPRISWQGGRAATQYLEYKETLISGSWQAIFTNLPPTDVFNEWIDVDATAPLRFYRIRAVRE